MSDPCHPKLFVCVECGAALEEATTLQQQLVRLAAMVGPFIGVVETQFGALDATTDEALTACAIVSHAAKAY